MDARAADTLQNASEPRALRLSATIDPAINFAIQQNSVPVIRDFTVTNETDAALQDLRIKITSDPEFSAPCQILIERVAPGSTFRPRLPALQLHAGMLSSLTEAMKGSLHFTAWSGGQLLAEYFEEVRLLAYDEWAGLQSLPEILAAFSQPNHPVVDRILAEATHLLASSGLQAAIEGYQSRDPRRIWQITAAIYAAIARRSVAYANPPASFETTGQKIRTPDRITSAGVATCLDLVMLFAACLEQAGLHPLVLIQKGHAFAGVWLSEECFPTAVIHDLQALRKRVKLQELLVFETTAVTGPAPASFEVAISRGDEHLEQEALFEMALDIQRARLQRILPLPLRADDGRVIQEVPPESAPATILPEAPGALTAMPAEIEPATESSRDRIERWRRKLLDLSLRNRQLNWKETRATVRLICPGPASLEEALAAGRRIRFRPLESVLHKDDPRSAETYQERDGEDLLVVIARNALEKNELLVRLPEEDLTYRLTEIYRASVNALEEGGANTLFLAFGFLSWQQREKTSRNFLAPILLVPVTLERPSIRHGFTLIRHDDEAQVNPTLLEMLQQDFQLHIAGVDPPPTSADGIDIVMVLRRFREAVRDIAGWEVLDQVTIGLFSFAKYLMWKDLQDRAQDLRSNEVMRRLIEPDGDPAMEPGEIPRAERLDDECLPSQMFCPMVADSSQLVAVAAVRSGRSFVLDGPPGTGKSQTITNIIAHCLAEGKRVLFVSEKMAALDVVHRRLKQVGLGPFCLQLHSAKAKRAEVVAQLAHTLQYAGQHSPDDWNRLANRITLLRSDLNTYVRELHQPHPNGWTAYRALSHIIANPALPACDMAWADPDEHSESDFHDWKDLAHRLASLASGLGPSRQCLSGLSHEHWSLPWENSFRKVLGQLEAAARDLAAHAESLQTALGLPTRALSVNACARLNAFAEVLLDFPQDRTIPPSLLLQADFRSACAQAYGHGRQRHQLWNALNDRYRLDALTLSLSDLKNDWIGAEALWWPTSWLERQRIRRILRSVSSDGAMPPGPRVMSDLAALGRVADEESTLSRLAETLARPLASLWQGTATDWDRLARISEWGERAQSACLAVAGDAPDPQVFLQQLVQRLDHDADVWLSDGMLSSRLAAFTNAWRAMLSARADFEEVITVQPALIWGDADQPAYATRVFVQCQQWSAHLANLRLWCNWHSARSQAEKAGLQPLLALLDGDSLAAGDLPAALEYNYARWWIGRILDRSQALRSFVGAGQTRTIEDFRAVDDKFTNLTGGYIVARLSAGIPTAQAVPGSGSEMGILMREMQKKSRHLALRRLIESIPNVLSRLAPCFLMSPLSVAQYLDASHPAFDLVIFDEASQIPVWDAIGAMTRARQVVVAGDPKQLPPTSFFGRGEDDDEIPDDDLLVDLESILDECIASRLQQLSLRWHYRSRNESLIAFSNRRYYENNLYTFPSPVTNDGAVVLHPVQGVYDRGGSRTNRTEADAVVRFILGRLQSRADSNTMPSIGVVTFNQQQQTLITDLLDQARHANPELDAWFASDLAEPVLVKNLENVQGDERDVMIFSTTYGPDAAGKLSSNFGPLNKTGGERRLNVAITRARVELHVFSSLNADQIDLSRTRARGVEDLKLFLDYARRGPQAIVEAAQAPLGETESPFEEEVLRSLSARGWTVHAQIGCSGYRIDLAVVDPRSPGRYLLGIECDGAMYHSAATARDRDRLRAMVLKKLGWTLYRVWSTDWWTDANAEIRKLEAVLEERLAAETPLASPEPFDATAVGLPEEHAELPTLGQAAATASEPPDEIPALDKASLLPTYRAEILPSMPNQDAFYSAAMDASLRDCILRVIETEGPIAEHLLVRRLSDAWGFQRTGNRIRSRVLALVPRSILRTTDGDATYYWPQGVDPGTYADVRLPGTDPAERRDVSCICQEELANLLIHVIAQHAGVFEEQVLRDACRLLGIRRVSEQIEQRLRSVLKHLQQSNRISTQAGSLIIPR